MNRFHDDKEKSYAVRLLLQAIRTKFYFDFSAFLPVKLHKN